MDISEITTREIMKIGEVDTGEEAMMVADEATIPEEVTRPEVVKDTEIKWETALKM